MMKYRGRQSSLLYIAMSTNECTQSDRKTEMPFYNFISNN